MTYYYSFILTILAVVMAVVGIGTYWHQQDEIAALNRAWASGTNDKVKVCTKARLQTTGILRGLMRSDEAAKETAISQALQLSIWMPYCDGDIGRKWHTAIEDAVMVSIDAAAGGAQVPVNIDAIRDVLLAFGNARSFYRPKM